MKNRGAFFALMAAVLFGASTPFAKLLLNQMSPFVLAGLLYVGAGVGLFVMTVLWKIKKMKISKEAALSGSDWKWLSGATFFGGLCGPVFLMMGIARTSATAASLLLNVEGVFTAFIAWFVLKEHFDRRILLGMLLILSGGFLLSWSGTPGLENFVGPLLIAAACLCWAIDNNLTRKISAQDPLQISMIKCLAAGVINTLLALILGSQIPGLLFSFMAGLLGLASYGLSLLFFILALRNIGTSRTGAYFSLAPFVGAALSVVVLGGEMTLQFLGAAILMGLGVYLHLTEKHSHEHVHEVLKHEHIHIHDAHHQHTHTPTDPPGEPHSHWHQHEELVHTHVHFPDIHHRHRH